MWMQEDHEYSLRGRLCFDGDQRRNLQTLLDRTITESRKYCMEQNEKKSHGCYEEERRSTASKHNGWITRLESVEKFKYLSTTFNWDAKDDSEITIRIRIAVATKAFNDLESILRNKGLSFDVRRNVLVAYVFAIATCSCETWSILAQMAKKLNSFEMRFFRKM